jgi:prophage regulatory protein
MTMPNDFAPQPRGQRLLKRTEVEARVGLGTSTIYRRMEQGTFPRPRHLGGGVVRWLEADIIDWIESLELTRPRSQAA